MTEDGRPEAQDSYVEPAKAKLILPSIRQASPVVRLRSEKPTSTPSSDGCGNAVGVKTIDDNRTITRTMWFSRKVQQDYLTGGVDGTPKWMGN